LAAWPQIISLKKDSAKSARVEIARIEEQVWFTSGGLIAVILLLLHNCLMFFYFLWLAKALFRRHPSARCGLLAMYCGAPALLSVAAVPIAYCAIRTLTDHESPC
jgi:hypothetical protein